jgi:maleate cis-trans isomerase
MRTTRIGMIIPSGGPEADYYSYEEAANGALKFYFTISRVGGDLGHDHDPDALRQTAQVEWLAEAAERLRPFRLDGLQWACTSGSFINGRAFAEAQAAAIGKVLGIPATSTSLAFAAALAHLGLRRVAVLATYPEPAARAFAAFLGEFGIDVARLDWLGAPSGWDAARFGESLITPAAVKMVEPGIEAVLIPDTALPSLHYLERLERRVGLPVLTANAVTIWDAERIAGRHAALPSFGSLLLGRGVPPSLRPSA